MNLKNKLYDLGLDLVDAISHAPLIGDAAHRELNRQVINHFAGATKARPRAHSLWSPVPGPRGPNEPAPDVRSQDYITDYTSWPGLTNRGYSGRHLPPAPQAYVDSLPEDAPYVPGQTMGQVTSLFQRAGGMIPSRSSVLFMFFAQWFTDSILRVHPFDRRMNTSTHDIDLCQIYGLTEETTRCLREMKGGRMRTRRAGDEEMLDYLCEPDGAGGFRVRSLYAGLPASQRAIDAILQDFSALVPSRKEKMYATGLERGNSSIGYVALSTIFVREHNRIAAELERNHPGWNDERIFQTARNINIVLEMKLIVEEYINHILGHKLFILDHAFAEEQHWYRANWIAIEFDMLYRWHGLAPDSIQVGDRKVPARDFRNNNALLEEVGIGPLLHAASTQRADRIGLGNTPGYLWGAEYASIKMGRDFRLASYNDYRERFGLDRLSDFSEITSDTTLQERLAALYGTVDRVEYIVGIFAQEAEEGLLFGDLLNRMVAYDAFTQIFSNPLLSTNVYAPATFTDYGLELIERTTSLQVLADRNVSGSFVASLGVVD